MSDYLRNARDFSIGDYSNLSTVHGIQNNNYYNQTTTCDSGSRRKRLKAESEEEEAQYAEYHDVRRGDIVIKRDLGTSNEVQEWFFDEEKQDWVCESRWERRFFTADVRSKAGKASSTYTVVSYHGPEKEKV
ncbi:hypothetical protein V5O48_001150 [Marasmius crinis-equi]|uniref:Uncharacterized protein n=1 Tax=Marasmius crinis-equi TaxID=585013 RepID=A0ABR3FZH6_9AGAR